MPRTHVRWPARRILPTLAVTLFISIILAVTPASALDTPKQAKRADAFVNSIGVNTHVNYFDTVYGNYPLVKAKLSDLGVRHIRDKAHLSSDTRYNQRVYDKYKDLAAVGIRANLMVDPRNLGLSTVDSRKIAAIKAQAGGSLESLEGPNEYDVSGSTNWAGSLRAYQRSLYQAVKTNESTARLPVLGPSLAHAHNAGTLGDLSAYMDYGNMHPYAGGEHPASQRLDNYNVANTIKATGKKPLRPTETGYHNAMRWSGPHPGVSERAAAKYMPRTALEYFNRGFSRTYSYELFDLKPDANGLDREKNFGLVRNDGTEKPAYRSMRNLIDLLEDPGPAFKPGTLSYSLQGETENVHRTLLQKRNGTFYLVLWQETSSFDLSAKKDISVPGKPVTLSLNSPVSNASVYLPNQSREAVSTRVNTQQISLNVPDHPLVVKLGASVDPRPTPTNTAPVIRNPVPAPTSTVKDRTPIVGATIRDREARPRSSGITLYVDGRRITRFSYNRRTGVVRHTVQRRMALGPHRVKVIARDTGGLRQARSWRFRILR